MKNRRKVTKKLFTGMLAAMLAAGSISGIGSPLPVNAEAEAGSTIARVNEIFESTRTDFRDESIYLVMTTRFYDGDTGNNVHCWDDSIAGNPDSDPAWRGDFKGLIEKLDYIKALGFTAVCVTPVAQNASSYDYHGEHPNNMKKIDARYESDGYTYEDFLNACEEKGMKVMQSITINTTGSFGEENLYPIFEKLQAKGIMNEDMKPSAQFLEDAFLASEKVYEGLTQEEQLQLRHSALRTEKDENNIYHHNTEYNWDDYTIQFATVAADCLDLNTENPVVYRYLVEVFETYMDMGVDAFLIKDTEKISRLTFNKALLPAIHEAAAQSEADIEIFGEAMVRNLDPVNTGTSYLSVPFYSWNTGAENYAWSDSEWEANYREVIKFSEENADLEKYPTEDNGFLSGLNYHEPDVSQFSGMHMVDFPMQWSFSDIEMAFGTAKGSDKYYNDPTWNITSVDNLDYGVDGIGNTRFNKGTLAWAENLNLLFTFRGIPKITYGTEVEFQKNFVLDAGSSMPLSQTGRAYFGDYLEGTVATRGFGEYGAVSGTVEDTLNSPLALHIQALNRLRQAIPALRKGQYTANPNYVAGSKAFIRRYTGEGIDSLALVTISDGATFKNIPNGPYVNAVTGEIKNVTNGTLSVSAPGRGNLAVYVCAASGFDSPGCVVPSKGVYIKGAAPDGGAQSYITGPVTPPGPTTEVTPTTAPDTQQSNWVYFKKPEGWSEKIRAYIWNENSEPVHGAWPGNEITNFGDGIYGCEIPEGGESIIFNDGSSQTSDEKLMPGMLYDGATEEWQVYVTPTPEVTNVPTPTEEVTPTETPGTTIPLPEYKENWVYFKKPESWGSIINAYVWNSDLEWIYGQWPGSQIMNFGNGIYGCEAPERGKFIIFNDGNKQTTDLNLLPGMLYDGTAQEWQVVITPTPEVTNVPTPTEEVTPVPTETESPVPTETEAPTPTETEAPTPTETEAPTPTETEAPTPTETEAPTPTETEAPTPTETEVPQPTETPVVKEEVTKVFDDVYTDWYTDYVQYVYDHNLMTGIKGTKHFAPNANITKAQVAQVLYNMENQPAVEDRSVFTELNDVYAAEWYANAVAWAYNEGVVTGDLNTKKFNPNADVTREQLALMIYRYASYKKYDVSATSDFAGLVNADKVANWSMDGVKWAVGAGLISGIEKNGVKDLAPQGNASRAQVAAILQRFCENVGE